MRDERRLLHHIIWLLSHSEEFYNLQLAAMLQPEFFKDPADRWFVGRALDHWGRYKRPLGGRKLRLLLDATPSTELEADRTSAEAVLKMYKKAKSYPVAEEDWQYVVDRYLVFVRARGLGLSIQDALDLLESDPEAAQEVLRRGASTAPGLVEDRGLSLREDLDLALESVREREQSVHRIGTGFPAFDEMLRGGIRPKELAVALAPTSVGKSHFLVWLAGVALRQNQRVLVYTLEMPDVDWYSRVVSNLTAVPLDDLTRREKRIRRVLRGLYESATIGQDADIEILEQTRNVTTVSHLQRSFEIREAQGRRPDLLIIDYAELMKPLGQYRNTYEAQGEIYTDLHDFAKEANVPIWTASQASKKALGAYNVHLRDIADSFRKAMIADFVVAMCQTEDEKTGKKTDGERMRLRVVKARRAQNPYLTVEVAPRFAISRFIEVYDPARPVPEEEEDDPDFPRAGQREMIYDAE